MNQNDAVKDATPEQKYKAYSEMPMQNEILYPDALNWRLEQPIYIALKEIQGVKYYLELVELGDGDSLGAYQILCKKFKIPYKSGEIEPAVLDLLKSALSEAREIENERLIEAQEEENEIILELCSLKILEFVQAEKVLFHNSSTALKANGINLEEKKRHYGILRCLFAEVGGNDVISDMILDELLAKNNFVKNQPPIQNLETKTSMDLHQLAKEVSGIIEIGDKSIAEFYNKGKFANSNRKYIIKLISFLKEKADEYGVALAYTFLVSELEKAHRDGVANSGLFVGKDFYQLEGGIDTVRSFGPLTDKYIRIKVSAAGRVYVCLDGKKIIFYICDEHDKIK